MTIIVGGNARGVGKTTLVCHVLRAWPGGDWVAVKISGHPHGTPPLPPREAQPKATERFLEAGAREAHLLRDQPEDRRRLEALVESGRNVIIESNRAVDWVRFDLYLLILDEGARNPKEPERCHLSRAAWVLPPRREPPTSLIAGIGDCLK